MTWPPPLLLILLFWAALFAFAYVRRQFGGRPINFVIGFLVASTATFGIFRRAYGPMPSRDVVLRMEQKLAQNPCIGSLDRWARMYFYGRDTTVVRAELKQAGINGYRAGWRILPQFGEGLLDDRQMQYASAQYDPESDHLTIRSCGPNIE